MSDSLPPLEQLSISDSLIDEATGRLDMAARLEGPNHTLFLDVRLPKGAEEIDGAMLFLMRAAVELHAEIQAGEELSDIEETLEDALKSDDEHAIDEGCDIYRGLLASKLKTIWRGHYGDQKLADLSAAQHKPWAG
ncbi:MAG: hypothetical protein JWO72_950 [Caulobacteraceae bacterium]|jgi:hypothetical protein|nr:hypothetical protein [Caulobacteraceae bacterium]